MLAVNLPGLPRTRNQSRAWATVATIAFDLHALHELDTPGPRPRDALQVRLLREAIARAEWLYSDARELAGVLDWLIAAADGTGGTGGYDDWEGGKGA